MKTRVILVNPQTPASSAIAEAAHLLADGELVAFPTETVYGLGALALAPDAVNKIFEAKGRPATNPLIVHVADSDQVEDVVSSWPEEAAALADAFWPGPLTIVLPKNPQVPDQVTAGLDTVGIRMPRHPVALALIRAAGPIAAPSANRYTGVSPTSAQHVVTELEGRVGLVLDAGSTDVGLESTVVSLAGEPRVLRPGMITVAALRQVVPAISDSTDEIVEAVPAMSPGQARRHYAPQARVVIASPSTRGMLNSKRLAVIRLGGGPALTDALTIDLPADPDVYARGLYEALHACDAAGCEFIVVEPPPRNDAWAAIWDRLRRASESE